MALERKTNKVIAEWLSQEHGVKISKSAVFRSTKAVIEDYWVLVEVGMPIPEIVAKRRHFEWEALTVDEVVLAYLDKMGEEAELMLTATPRAATDKPSDNKADVIPVKRPS